MTKRVYIMVAIAPILAGCGGGGGQTFAEKFAFHEELFAHVETNLMITPVGSLPPGTAVYSGVMGMTIDVDAMPDANVTASGGDFRAAGDFTINVDFGAAQSLSGIVNNLTADEGHSFAAGDTITISSTGLTGNTFPATYIGALTLDTFTLDIAGTFLNGQFKGISPDAAFIWGNHNGTVDWDGLGGDPAGTVSGGFVGQLQ